MVFTSIYFWRDTFRHEHQGAIMKGLKLILASICILLFLVIWSIGVLTGGGKGSESLLSLALIPLIIMVIGYNKKD